MHRLASLCLCALTLLACKSGEAEPSAVPESESQVVSADAGGEILPTHAIVGRELPGELVAELRLEGADENGQLLTLAPGFVASAACSDCGAPSYLRFLAVRCADALHCEVLTAECEGSIEREADIFELDFHEVETEADAAPADEGTRSCAEYSGRFEPTL